MRLLLDTHAFVWWTRGDPALSENARSAIQSGAENFVSAATAWEITTKHRLGKMQEAAEIAMNVEFAILDNGFELLPISVVHGQRAGALAGRHRDPFDRMLAAQALQEGLKIISADAQLDSFGVTRLW